MANTANITALTTDFNVTPYYDDYDGNKGYYRILFKPGYAIQARELTQMQTALQEQIQRFGRNIFKDGTIVLPGAFYLETNLGLTAGRGVRYVKVNDTDASGATVSMSQWQNFINIAKANVGNTTVEIAGLTSGIKARLIQTLDGLQSSSNSKTLYLSYTSASPTNSTQKVFLPGETLRANVDNSSYTLVVKSTDPVANTGVGSRFAISSGVLFAKNHFVAFPDQAVIIDRYNANPTARVGFYISEDIVTSSDDSSLLDPAREASNFSAPGADRLRLNPELAVVGANDTVDVQNFVTLFTLTNGVATSYLANTQYAYIDDAMARRTFDNSGDYVVEGMEVQVKEHDNTGSNFGRYTDGNNSLLYVGISAGTGYCEGYRVGSLATVDLSVSKGLTTSNTNGQSVAFVPGSYVTVDEFVGPWELNTGTTVDLYDTDQNRVASKGWSDAAQTGKKIGSAKVLSYQYTGKGSPGYDAQYNVFLSDINMLGSNTFSKVKNLYAAGSGSVPATGADVVLDVSGSAVLQGLAQSSLLFYTGSDFTKTIRSISDITSTDTTYSYSKSSGVASTLTVATDGTFTISLSPGTEIFSSGTFSGQAASSYYLTFNQTVGGSTTMANFITGLASSNTGRTLVGVATKFRRLNVGDKIQLSDNTSIYYVTKINSETSLDVDADLPEVVSGNTISKVYKSGDIINMNAVGADSGSQRSITATSTSLKYDLKETFASSFYATATYPISRTSALEIKKTLNSSRYVKINCGSNSAGVNGPFDLGFSDVYRVKSIRSSIGSYPASNTSGSDVLSSFTINNGQKDTNYDHATITPNITLDTNTYLLVELDYFSPDFSTGAGYFSIDSYPIQDDDTVFDAATNIRTENVPVYKSPTSGKTFDLRNHLDFRPVKTNTATDATSPASASINPAASSSYQTSAGGLKLPQASSNIIFDFYYYLGRNDLIVVDKNNNFQVISGLPSASPKTPDILPGTMPLALLRVAPYPSLSPQYAIALNRRELSCAIRKLSNMRYTMRDIGVLKERIVNLEYYTSLSLLEKAASTMKILDENGLDRFKNGIFTDNFRDNSLTSDDTQNRIVFDPDEKTIRPLYTMNTIGFDYKGGTNVKYNNPVVTLNYSEVAFIQQKRATSDINVERQSWLFLGTVSIYPDQDVWIDTTLLKDEELNGNTLNIVVYGTGLFAATRYETDRLGPATETLDNGQVVQATINYGKFKEDSSASVNDTLVNTEWKAWQKSVTGYKVYTGQGTARKALENGKIYSTYDEARNIANRNNVAGGPGVTIETIFKNDRIGTQYWESTGIDKMETGYKVVDVQNIPYVRPQTMLVHCRDMKPYTRMWPYFDNIPMSLYSYPLTDDQFAYMITKAQYGLPASTITDLTKGTKTTYNSTTGATTNPSATELGTFAKPNDPLVTDVNGSLKFAMQIQRGQVRVGQRNVLVIDSSYPIDPLSVQNRTDIPVDISTGGSAIFFASGQAVSKQRTVLSTKNIAYHTESISETAASSDYQVIAAPPPPAPASHSCSAYSFAVQSPNGDEGIFLTSVDIFVSRIGRQGFWCEVREMDAGQQITRNTIPYSEVFFNNPTSVPISTNGLDNPCKVTFQAPLFLYNNRQYAFVIHPINANPDLYVWVAKLGQTDVNGLGRVFDRRGYGTFYQTNNNTNWDIINDVDLTCNFYRAEFVKDQDGVSYLANRPIDKLFIRNRNITFGDKFGEEFISGDKLTITSLTGGTISVGDTVHGNTSFLNTSVVNVSAGLIHCSNTGYIQGERMYILDKTTGLSKGIHGTISDVTNAFGRLDYYADGDTSLVYLTGSGGGFVNGDYVIATTDFSKYGVIEKIESISLFRYSSMTFEPSYLSFKPTDIKFKIRPTSISGTLGNYIDVQPSEIYSFQNEQAVLSRSTELTKLSGAQSMNVQVTMRTSSNSLSPLVDTSRTHTIIIDNIINNSYLGETSPTHGTLLNKYISRVVTLEDGQDAEDLQVMLTAYRPPGTDVKVWAKFKSAEDPTPIDQCPWVEMYKEEPGPIKFSSLDNLDDFREFTYLLPLSTVDRLTLTDTKLASSANQTRIIAGNQIIGLTSEFVATINTIEGIGGGSPVYQMSANGFSLGENANVVNTMTGNVCGNTVISTIGRPTALVGGTSNIVSYTTDSGISYNRFKFFAIKIGLLNDGVNSAIVPRVGDLRAIALQR